MTEAIWLSPFTMLLRLYLNRIRVGTGFEQLRTLLKAIVRERQMLRSDASMTSLDSLVLSLQDLEEWRASPRVFEFLDHCILRIVKKPIHYYDMLSGLIAAAELNINPRDCQVDLLLITIMDQWHFLVKSADTPTITNVSTWLVRLIEVIDLRHVYVENLPFRQETTRLLSQILDQLKVEVEDNTCRAEFEKALEERPEHETLKELVVANTVSEPRHMAKPAGFPLKRHTQPPGMFLPPEPPEEHEDHPGLHQWTRHEVQDAISEGHVKALILCLCSKHVEIRKQALTGGRALMMKLKVREFTYTCNQR